MEQVLRDTGASLGRFTVRRVFSLACALSFCSVSVWGLASLLVYAGPTVPRWTCIVPLYGIAMASLWIWSDLFEWDPVPPSA